MSRWHIAVLVPARDEEDLLPRCLRSIQRARQCLPATVTSDLVIISDSSTDRTFELAQQLVGRSGVVKTGDYGSVGSARIEAATAALGRCPVPLDRCWLANSDADCEVPEDWLVLQVAIAERGIAAVAGIVDVDCFAEHLPHVPQRFRDTYIIRADGTHPHVHGANLGIRADAYLKAGGWANLTTAEDHDLWGRLGACGVGRLSTSGLQVLTSGRRAGRAPMGFAGALASHNEVPL